VKAPSLAGLGDTLTATRSKSDLFSVMKTLKAIGYARVSTDGQAEKGISLAAQESRIRAMATLQEVELLEVIVDPGESGKNLKRPGMVRLLSLVNARAVDTVIIAKLDRITRSVKDLSNLMETFERRGIQLLSVAESLDTGSAAGRLVMNIMTSLAAWELQVISERTTEALDHLKKQSRWVGNCSYGFHLCSDGKTVEPDPHEQRVKKTITRLRDGGGSLRQIAAYLNKERRYTRSGSPWRHCYIARILKTG
jgi:DNA invertase Pin-like site-specific DNA recombinase